VTHKQLTIPTYSELFCTCLGVGKVSKKMPGTLGSLISIPLSVVLLQFSTSILKYCGIESAIASILLPLFLNFILFVLGVVCAGKYCAEYKIKDPAHVVIDEVVGMNFVLLVTIPVTGAFSLFFPDYFYRDIVLLCTVLFSLVLFRFFDIYKPWPIDVIDKNVKGGLGVMLDDAVAAIFAIILYCAGLLVTLDALAK